MNWTTCLSKSAAYLEERGVPDARVAAELLVARLLRIGRGLLLARLAEEANEEHLAAMRRGLKRLVSGEPVQYVLGEWDFRSLTLRCDKRALVPRPETEELVTRVLADLKKRAWPRPFVLDVGTGTGAIILSLAKEYANEAILLGTDISEDAIALARENAAQLGLASRVKFAVADGLDDFDEAESVDMIVSNPPYIATRDLTSLDPRVRDFEPRLALDGGVQGLDFYERYLADALNLLKRGGRVHFELGESQGEAVRKMMADFGFTEIAIEKDFAGHDRYASATLP